jgi:manganese/zinc/iron transport system permease protein
VSQAQLEIQLIAALTAAACALPGAFLLLRRMAMLSDAIAHAILPGIVVAFFVTRNLASPLLLAGATATGVLTVVVVETLLRSRRLRQDAAIGLTFPVFFSVGIILISRYAGNVHLDTDAVLLGELAFAPFDRLVLGGVDVGARALWLAAAVLAVNLAFVLALFKELKVATFDAALAGALGLAPAVVHYALTAVVSLTAVAAFDTVGSVLVVALMIAPPAAAYLLADRLGPMIALSAAIGVASAVAGYWVAVALDASIAGAIAALTGAAFAAALLLSPERGLVAAARRRRENRRRFAFAMLALHLGQHEALGEEAEENRVATLHSHLGWTPDRVAGVVADAERRGLLHRRGDILALTERGRTVASAVVRQ